MDTLRSSTFDKVMPLLRNSLVIPHHEDLLGIYVDLCDCRYNVDNFAKYSLCCFDDDNDN